MRQELDAKLDESWLTDEKRKEVVNAAMMALLAPNGMKFWEQDPATTNPWALPDGVTMRRYTQDEFLALPPETVVTDIFGVQFERKAIPDYAAKAPAFVRGDLTAFGKVIGH